MSNLLCTEANDTTPLSVTKCILDQFLSPVLVVVGAVGCLVALYIVNRRNLELKPSFKQLVVLQLIFDLIYLLTVLLRTYSAYFPSTWCTIKYVYPVMSLAYMGSVQTTIALTVERFYSLKRLEVKGINKEIS